MKNSGFWPATPLYVSPCFSEFLHLVTTYPPFGPAADYLQRAL